MKEKYFEQYDKLVEPLCSMCKSRFCESFADYEDELDIELTVSGSISYGWKWSDEEFSFWEFIVSNMNHYIK